MPSEVPVLRVDGRDLEVYESLEVTRSLEAIAGSVDARLPTVPRWWGLASKRCEVLLGQDEILTGNVDSVECGYGEDGVQVSLRGRDATAELVDCSVPPDQVAFWSQDLYAIAVAIADRYGVQVVQAVDVGDPFYSFTVQPSETAFEAIERACRLRGVLATTDGLGRLVLTRARTEGERGALYQGSNLLSASLALDDSARYRTYLVRSQSTGSDLVSGASAAGSQGAAVDLGARPGRTLLVIAEGALDDRKAQQRASWEAVVRRARAQTVRARVVGWRWGPGLPVWQPNQLARVVAPSLGLDTELLVVSVKLSVSDREGMVSDLQLTVRDAYRPERIGTAEDDLLAGLGVEGGEGEE